MMKPDGTDTKKSRKKSTPLLFRITLPMILLSILQILIISAALALNGEFSNIKRFSYNSLSEKTKNRSNYVENALNQKTELVYETANSVGEIVSGILREENLNASAVTENKELNKRILAETADELISLIQRDMVNDAFLILNTGTLYCENGSTAMAGLYLRDTDVNEKSVANNADIYVEIGSSQLAHDLGLSLDSEWSLHLDMTDRESGNFDFFYKTVDLYAANPDTPLYQLGLWSRFSGVSQFTQQSLKYTLPLAAEDGTVYGVIGVGLLKKTVLQSIPESDFFDESACYILGADFSGNGTYEALLSSGPAYKRLVDSQTVLSPSHPSEYGLYDFSSNGPECVGSIQNLTLYHSGSPLRGQKWALISVADKEKTLNIYLSLIRIFVISVAITLLAGVLFAFFVSKRISLPVTRMVKSLEISRKNNTLVSFRSSGITEIDNLAGAIVELQVDATEYASRVSRIITMAGSRIGVFLYDCRSRMVFVGESLTRLLGFSSLPDGDTTISADEFHSQLIKIDAEDQLLGLPMFSPEDGDYPSKNIEITYQEPDGTARWLRFALTRDGSGVVGLVQDITGEIQEKKEIAQVKDDEYTEMLLKANASLRDAYALAKQANHAKTDFLSRMSHDIRTPMNAIIGMTAIAEMNLDNSEKVADCLGKIENAGRYLLSLINEVLDMSKIESGKLVLAEENISMPDLVDNIAEIVRPSVKEKHHELLIDISSIKHPYVIGDSTRIQQAFVNILSNAVKYTPPGGHLQMTVTEKPFHQKKIGCYEFVFRDDGIGMSQEFLQKLYDPFERSTDVRVSKEQGTGLGMAITKNIVELMDGTIQAESELGKGTVFTVTIFLKLRETQEKPAQKPESETGAEKSLSELSKSDFSGFRALLAEDNELNREIACEILQMTGLKVDAAVNGKEAVEKFSACDLNSYQIILMDIQMPVMNGYEAAAAIRALPREDAAKIPIVAMTANTFAEDVQAAKNAGMNEHIAKPLDFGKLTETLNRWLKR